MRTVIQRVKKARITINQSFSKEMGDGLVVLLGIEQDDKREDLEWLCGKIARLRIFSDKDNKMNLSVQDTGGEIMVVSQFTLHASTKKGNRPSWIRAAEPGLSEPLYNEFIKELQKYIDRKIIGGEFGAHMDIELINDGPVTIFIDTKNKE